MQVKINSKAFDKVLKRIRDHFSDLEYVRSRKVLDTLVSMSGNSLILENGCQGFYLKQTLPISEVIEPLATPFFVDALMLSQLSIPTSEFSFGYNKEQNQVLIRSANLNLKFQTSQSKMALIEENKPRPEELKKTNLWNTLFDDVKKYCDLPSVFSSPEILPIKIDIDSNIGATVADEFCGACYKKPLETPAEKCSFVIPFSVIEKFFKDKFKVEKDDKGDEIIDKKVTISLAPNYIVLETNDAILAHPLLQTNVSDVAGYIAELQNGEEIVSFECIAGEFLSAVKQVSSVLKKDDFKTGKVGSSVNQAEKRIRLTTAGSVGEATDIINISNIFSKSPTPFFNMSVESLLKFVNIFDSNDTIQFNVYRGIVIMSNKLVKYVIPQLG